MYEKILLLLLFIILVSCTDEQTKNYKVEYIPVKETWVLKKFDPVIQMNQDIYLAVIELNKKEIKIKVKNDKINTIKVHEKLPS